MNLRLSVSVNDLHVLKTYFPHLETSVVTSHLQAVTLNWPLISLAFTSLLNGLDKWVWGAPYATKWSVPHISMAIMSCGLRAGWCPVCSSVASKQLHYVSEPLRIVLYVFCCRALWIQEDLSPEIHGAEGGDWACRTTASSKYAKEYGVVRQTCRCFINPWGRFDESIHRQEDATATFGMKLNKRVILPHFRLIHQNFCRSFPPPLCLEDDFFTASPTDHLASSPPSIWTVCQAAWRINEHYYSTLGMKEERQQTKEIEVEREGGVKSIIIWRIIV